MVHKVACSLGHGMHSHCLHVEFPLLHYLFCPFFFSFLHGGLQAQTSPYLLAVVLIWDRYGASLNSLVVAR
jgi:hypothetical protein